MAQTPGGSEESKPPEEMDGIATQTMLRGLAAIRNQLATLGVERHAANRAVLETTQAQAGALREIRDAVTRVERAMTGDDMGNVGLIARVMALDARLDAQTKAVDARMDAIELKQREQAHEVATYKRIGLAIVAVFGTIGAVVLWLLQVREQIGPPKP